MQEQPIKLIDMEKKVAFILNYVACKLDKNLYQELCFLNYFLIKALKVN